MNRKPDPINVFIVEQHNNVLNVLYRGIGSKKIPYSNLKLLHYDAHPDLGISTSSRRTIRENPSLLLSECSIENWILPAIYGGHVDHVIWMRPPYCNQMGDRISKEYHVGYIDTDGGGGGGKQMVVDINDLYFINEGNYCKTDLIEDKVKFKLSVGPIHYTHTMCRFCYDINIQLMNSNFILDIDLDTFAPVNPFRDRFTPMQESLITNIYGVPKTDDAIQALEELKNQPYPFRLKHVRYPAKKCDGQIPSVPKGSLPDDVASSMSSNRRNQLNQLQIFLKQIQFGILPINYEAVKLFGLLTSIMGLENLLNHLKTFEINLQSKISDSFTQQENQFLKYRLKIPILPDSFLRQIESIFQNERSKCIFFVLHELENVYNQLKSEAKSDDGLYINWLRSFNLRKSDDSNSSQFLEEDQGEDHIMYWHYLFSSCGFEWNNEHESLPHRPMPDNSSFQDSLDDLTSLLNRLHSPVMITIARSADDGYIRQDVVDRIQAGVIQCLEKVYENRNLNIIKYNSENSYFLWPSSKRHGQPTKHINEMATVTFRTPASTDSLENKDIL